MIKNAIKKNFDTGRRKTFKKHDHSPIHFCLSKGKIFVETSINKKFSQKDA